MVLAAPLLEPRTERRARRSFDVWNEVPLVPQLTTMSCWAAAAAMIVGWRERVPVDAEELAKGAGRWRDYREGLQPHDLDELARVFGLVIEPTAGLSVERLLELLERVGPLWIGEASPGLHSIVVTGIYGDGTPGSTFVRINDPWPQDRGERYVLSYSEFSKNFRAATLVVGEHAQVLHGGGGRGRRRSRSSYEEQSRTTTISDSSEQENAMSMHSYYQSSYGGDDECKVCKPYSAGAQGLSAVDAGEIYLDTAKVMSPDPLAKHATTSPASSGDNLFLRWNAMSSDTSEIDVVVHFHGYASLPPTGAVLRDKVAGFGGDLSARTRPTLLIVPRGRKITEAEIRAACTAPKPSCPNPKRYTFPGIVSRAGFQQLVSGAVDYFTTKVLGAQTPPGLGKLILSGHSGGGAALGLLAGNVTDGSMMPNELYVYDALYSVQQGKGIRDWVIERLKDPDSGALRIFYRSGDTEKPSLAVLAGLSIPAANKASYRAERTSLGHGDVDTKLNPKMLTDSSADVLGPTGAVLGLADFGRAPAYGTPVGLFHRYSPASPMAQGGYSDQEIDEIVSEGQGFYAPGARAFKTAPAAAWAADAVSPDYRHIQSFAGMNQAFALTPAVLKDLADANHFDLGEDQFIIYALRGATITSGNDGLFHASVQLDDDIPDHRSCHCVIGVWDRVNGQVAAFTGSTVPHETYMAKQFLGTDNANMAVTGLHMRVLGTHRKKVHGVLRQSGDIVGIRSNDNLTYTTRDVFDSGYFGDNLHPTFKPATMSFSSAGCLTVRGTASGYTHSDPDDRTPGWATLRERLGLARSPSLDSEDGTLFRMMLLTGREAQILAAGRGAQSDLVRLRFGSTGPDVTSLQMFLAKKGHYTGTVDGSMGPATVIAWVAYQRARDVAAGVAATNATADGIVTPTDATSMGFTMVAAGAPGGQSNAQGRYYGSPRARSRFSGVAMRARPLVYRGFDHYGRPRAWALVDENSSQADQSLEIRKNVGRSLAQWESGNKFDILHYDSGRVNVGIGSWTGARIAALMDGYETVATAAGSTATLYGYFGGQTAFDDVRTRFRTKGVAAKLSAGEEKAFRDTGGDTTMQQAQIDLRASDVVSDLKFIANDGNPWYPFIDGGIGAISEVAAHVLVHAMHQSGNAGFRSRLTDAIAFFGGETKLGDAMVKGTVTELDFLAQVAEQVVANVKPKYQTGVRNRYNDLMTRFGPSKLAFYFNPA